MTFNITTSRVVTTREITKTEVCWLDASIEAGTLLVIRSDTYGCCGSGIAVGFAGIASYFEVPADAVIGINEEASAARV